MAADKVGPNGAVQSLGVDVSTGSLLNCLGDVKPTLTGGSWVTTDTDVPATSQTIVPWKAGAIGMTSRYAVARWGDTLYRSHKGFSAFPATLNGIQYTSNSSTPPRWDFLGLMTPGTPTFAVADAGSGSGLAAGTYTYYCTFYNTEGHESPAATATVTLSSARNVTVTLPQAYTTANTTSGSATITSIADVSKIRPGMRIQGSGIPTDTYVIAVSGTSATLSDTATSTLTATKIVDAQVDGTRVYRMGMGITTPKLVEQTVGLATTSFPDSKSNSQLQDEITVLGSGDIGYNLRDVSISPSGVLFCVGPQDTIVWFSLRQRGLYSPEQVIPVKDAPLATIYALDRFICPTRRGCFTVTIEDAINGIPIVADIDDSEPCQASNNVYACDVGGEVWWNTNKGIVSTNGVTMQTVTKYTFARTTAEALLNAYGAEFFNGTYYLYGANSSDEASLYSYSRETGWTIITNTLSKSSPGTLGFHIGDGCIIYTGNTSDVTASVRKLLVSGARKAGGVFETGEWSGEKASALKKFRKVSVTGSGDFTVNARVDGNIVAAKTFSSANFSRFSFWLPSGTKGRKFSVAFILSGATAEIEEVGVWIGEQREPMP